MKIVVDRTVSVRNYQTWECDDVPEALLLGVKFGTGEVDERLLALDAFVVEHGVQVRDEYGPCDEDDLWLDLVEGDPNDEIVETWQQEHGRTPDHLRDTLNALRELGYVLTRAEESQ